MTLFENKKYRDDLKRASEVISIEENTTILITGATGLIGSFLVDVFLYYNRNNEKTINIIATSRKLENLLDRFSYVKESDCIQFVEHNALNPIDMNDKIEYIIHAASNADPVSYALYPAETINTNVLGTYNVLEYIKSHMKTKAVLLSTMEVYGEISMDVPYTEEMSGKIDFNMIRSGYPESKRVAELMVRSYVKEYDIQANIARLGYIYGPSMLRTDSKVVAQFIRKAIEKKDIILKSKGLQKRSYCHISDAAKGILFILFKGEQGGAYNVASSKSVVSIFELAKIVADIAQTDVVFDKPDEIEEQGFSKVQDNILDTKKLEKLGWKCTYDIYDGIDSTVQILKEDGIEC